MRFFVFLLLCSCGEPIDEKCGNLSFDNIYSDYHIRNPQITSSGITVGTSGQKFNLDILDRVTNEVYSCLKDTFPSAVLFDDVLRVGYCHARKINFVPRSCIKVKIPNDWRLSLTENNNC